MWTPLHIPASPKQPFTDYSRWRLRDTDDGRHVWDFLKSAEDLEARPPCNADRYWLNLPLVSFRSILLGAFFLKYSLYRISHCSPVPKVHWTQPGTDILSIDSSNQMEAIGLASMADPCFFYLASS